jgi:UDP-N-acetylmuramyl pentapeptide phosphotransferase/UDP-N-acetylglucosamine-1-phosphate transferase
MFLLTDGERKLELIALVAIFVGSAISLRLALSSGLAARLAVDSPNARSLHSNPTPRGGGLFFLPWSIAGAFWMGGKPQILGMAVALGVLSLSDDRKGLPIHWRLTGHLAAALVAASAIHPGSILGWFIVVLGIAWMTNLYNFMDGSDGLAGGMAVIGFGCYAIAAWMAGDHQLSLVCWCLVAGTLAFLVFNVPPAKVFMGDVGSVPLGFLAAAIGFFGWREGIWPVWFPPLVFSFFIIDATATLLRRAVRGERVWEAHREHSYQRLIRSGWSHRRLMLISWSIMLLAGITALVLLDQPVAVVTAGLAGWFIIYAGLLTAVEARWRHLAVPKRGAQ